jgi:hypothetical protein
MRDAILAQSRWVVRGMCLVKLVRLMLIQFNIHTIHHRLWSCCSTRSKFNLFYILTVCTFCTHTNTYLPPPPTHEFSRTLLVTSPANKTNTNRLFFVMPSAINYSSIIKVKQYHYRPGVAQSVQGS